MCTHRLPTFRYIASIVACIAVSRCANATEPPKLFLLPSIARFSLGDDTTRSADDFDDSNWSEIEIPGGWMAQGFDYLPYVGWYRLRFDYHAPSCDKAALTIGPVRAAYEVYLNGKRIGCSGVIDERYFYSEEFGPKIFSIPDELLKIGQSNLLAIRVQRIVTDGGIKGGPLGIGEEAEVRLHYEQQRRRTYAWEAAFLMFYGSTLLFSVILWFLGLRDARHFWFAVVILQIGLSHFLYSNLLVAAGGVSYLTTVLAVLLDQCFPVSTLMFLAHTFQKRIDRKLRVALWIYGLLCAAWWINIHTINALYFWWSLLAIGVFSPVGLVWCVQGLRRGHPDALPLLIGSFGLFALLSYYVAYATAALNSESELLYRSLFVPFDWYAWLCIHLSMIYTLAAGYERTRRQLRKTSQGILQAHEDERKRVARELHDGVGQLLSAVKLRLDLLGQQSELASEKYVQEIQQSAQDTDLVFDELRRVASDLRPEALQRKGLLDAIYDLAEKVTSQTKAQVSVSANAEINGSIPGADHVYRIVQESVNNAVRHGAAESIEIDIQLQDEKLGLSIQDNGCGFDSADHDAPDGLGLASMRERVEFLGGQLCIDSKPGTGTRIVVEELPT